MAETKSNDCRDCHYIIIKFDINKKVIIRYIYFDVKDEPRSGQSITEKSDEMVKVERDKHVSTVEIARELGIDHKTVLNHLHKAGYKKKLDVWVPHEC